MTPYNAHQTIAKFRDALNTPGAAMEPKTLDDLSKLVRHGSDFADLLSVIKVDIARNVNLLQALATVAGWHDWHRSEAALSHLQQVMRMADDEFWKVRRNFFDCSETLKPGSPAAKNLSAKDAA